MYNKEYYQANKEKMNRSTREWEKRNPEKYKTSRKKYCQENKEKISKRNRIWYQKTKEQRNQYQREYYKDNKEKISNDRKEWIKKNYKKAQVLWKKANEKYRNLHKKEEKERKAIWYKKNKSEIRLRQKEYRSRKKLMLFAFFLIVGCTSGIKKKIDIVVPISKKQKEINEAENRKQWIKDALKLKELGIGKLNIKGFKK